MSYALNLRGEVLEMVLAAPPGGQRHLLELVRSLTAQPFKVADREERDTQGRVMKTRRGRGCMAVFQVDHLRREVLLTEVRRLAGR